MNFELAPLEVPHPLGTFPPLQIKFEKHLGGP